MATLYFRVMISPTKVIVKVEKRYQDEIDFNDGKLWKDTSYNPEWNVFPYGVVHSVPMRLPNDGLPYDIKVGDKLYMTYTVLMDDSNMVVHEGEEYWMVDLFSALAVARDGKVIPLGQHILIKKEEEEKESEFIIIPDSHKTIKVNRGYVFASNDPEIPNGAYVTFEEVGMFENEIEGETVYVMYNFNILFIHNQSK